MKKLMYYLSFACLAAFATTACQSTEDIPDAGEPRHQVTNLTATPGDEEVLLAWDMPEGWNPTDFIIFFTGDDTETVTLTTGGEMKYTVDGLTNEKQYDFNVQAVYGESVSQAVTVSGTPTTSRIAVKDLQADADDASVVLTWTKPSALVIGYTLTYYMDETPDAVESVEIDADATSYTVEGLTNDKNYTFSLVANYAKGASEAASARALPTLAIPFFLSSDSAAVGQPITFTFNREGYPEATDVKWIFPGNKVVEGETVSQALESAGEKVVTLSIMLGSTNKTWNINLNIREYVVYGDSWDNGGAGFRGGNPVFSPDAKTVYVVTRGNSHLYAYDIASGEIKWEFTPDVTSSNYSTVTVNPITGDIYYGLNDDTTFYSVSPEGKKNWDAKLGANCNQGGATAVSKDGKTVFALDNSGNVFSFDAATGAQNWSYAATGAGGCLLVNGNELVVGVAKAVHFLNVADGSVIAKVDLKFDMMNNTGFGVSLDKTVIYVPGKGANNSPGSGKMASISLTTHEAIVAEAADKGDNNFWCPVTMPSGDIVIPNKDGYVYCYDKDLNMKWRYMYSFAGKSDPATNAFNFGRPCVDTDGNVYISAGQTGGVNLIISPAGDFVNQWSYTSEQGQMGGNAYVNGVLYSTAVAGVFVGKYVGGQLYGYDPDVTDPNQWQWMGCSGGDICNSWCLR